MLHHRGFRVNQDQSGPLVRRWVCSLLVKYHKGLPFFFRFELLNWVYLRASRAKLVRREPSDQSDFLGRRWESPVELRWPECWPPTQIPTMFLFHPGWAWKTWRGWKSRRQGDNGEKALRLMLWDDQYWYPCLSYCCNVVLLHFLNVFICILQHDSYGKRLTLSALLPHFQGETGKQGPVGPAGSPGIQVRHLRMHWYIQSSPLIIGS